MLDERFDALLKDMIEKKPNNPLSHGTLKTARRYWRDYIKPNYTGPLDESDLCEPGYWVPVPGVTGIANVELSDGHLYIEKYVHALYVGRYSSVQSLNQKQKPSSASFRPYC